MQSTLGSSAMELRGLAADPREEWRRLLRFVGWGPEAYQAAVKTVEPLTSAMNGMVAATYDYLARVPETAAVLGWETHVDQGILEERRRFFTVWMARTLSLDTSDDFALYLFRAGHLHAGLGPRRADVPSAYVVTSIGLILDAFAATLQQAHVAADVAVPALGAWAKYLSAQLQLMLLGDATARELQRGTVRVSCALFERLCPIQVADGGALQGWK